MIDEAPKWDPVDGGESVEVRIREDTATFDMNPDIGREFTHGRKAAGMVGVSVFAVSTDH